MFETKDKYNIMYIYSLDADKYFDKIWHNGLFYKLYIVLPIVQWLFCLLGIVPYLLR